MEVFKGEIRSTLPSFSTLICIEGEYNGKVFSIKNNKLGDSEKSDIVSYSLDEDGYAINVKLIEKSKIIFFNKTKYKFESKQDIKDGFEYLKQKLEFQKKRLKSSYNNPEILQEKIDGIIDIIDDFFSSTEPNFDSLKPRDLHLINDFEKKSRVKRDDNNYWYHKLDLADLWDEAIDISNEPIDKGRELDFRIIWQEWYDDKKQEYNFGFAKDKLIYSYTDKGVLDGDQTTKYNSNDIKSEWDIMEVTQKGKTYFIASAPVCEIAQASYIPALPPILGVQESANRILSKDRKTNEWQREAEAKRIRSIQQFIEESQNVIVNTPLLFINNPNAAYVKDKKLIIDYSKFLQKQESGINKGDFVDRIKRSARDNDGNIVYDEYRPLWLIDGQHRVKGIRRSEMYHDISVPIVIFPHDFGVDSTAKVFAEINTLQKKLSPLHELFMQHRFSISHTNKKRTFREYKSVPYSTAVNEGWDKEWEDSRANHLSYELLAKLAKTKIFKDKVVFLPQNKITHPFVSADQWLNYSREWFKNKCYSYNYYHDNIEQLILEPSDEELKMSCEELYFTETSNYFKAVVSTCNHDKWETKGHSLKWTDEAQKKCLLQKKSHFIILLELFPLIKDKVKIYKQEKSKFGIVTINDFEKVLKPFLWVDWRDTELNNTYGGGGEKGRRSLECWMADAIIEGKSYPLGEVHNSEYQSKPGRGINSFLGIPNLELRSTITFPTKKRKVKLKSTRPYNARNVCFWKVTDMTDNTILEGKTQVPKHQIPIDAEFEFGWHKDFTNLNKIKVIVEWKNALARTGKKAITLTR